MEDFKPLGSNELENIEGGSFLAGVLVGLGIAMIIYAITNDDGHSCPRPWE